jgi:hypothetical protein
MDKERVGKDTAELRHWRERALQELEAEQPTALEVEASTPRTVGLEQVSAIRAEARMQ